MKVNIGEYRKKKDQKISVQIDPWDTWSLDYTMSHILLPALKQLKAEKQGAPCVDNADVPKRLWSTGPVAMIGDIDEHWFARWDYVLDEMIFANEWLAEIENDMLSSDDGMYEYDTYGNLRALEERAQEGFRLMGLFWNCLWD